MSRRQTTIQRPPQGLERKGRFLRESQKPQLVQIHARRRQAFELRAGGMSCEQVGYRLAADPAINTKGEAFPAGYGWFNYKRGRPPLTPRALAKAVSDDLCDALERNAALEVESGENFKAVVVKRMEMVTQAMWPEAMKGNHWSAFRVIQVAERLSKMHGWDSEKRISENETNVTVRGTFAESPQPPIDDPVYLRKVLDALAEGGLETPEAVEKAKAFIPDVDVIDAVVVE